MEKANREQLKEKQKEKMTQLCITIPLKGGTKNVGPLGQPGQALSQDFIRAIQDEYATRYLEIMNIQPTARNKKLLLEKKPLTACEITPSWNSSGWLADYVNIYPNKIKKQSYENQRDLFLQMHANREKQREMEEDKKLWEFKDEYSDKKGDFKDLLKATNDKVEDITKRRATFTNQQSNPPSSTDRLGLDDSETANQKKRHFEMNLDPQYWQQKFLYPFSLDLAPLRLDAESK